MKSNLKVVISTILLVSAFGKVTYSSTLEDDNVDDDIINIENNYVEEVDTNSMGAEKIKVAARNAIAIDGKTKQILFNQNGDEIVPMASTTKIITALIAINQGDLDKEFTISKNAASIRGSKVGYSVGEKIKLRELLFGLMFRSGNDAAIAIAEGIGGSLENFAKIMNHYALSLGLTNSHFESPHGLDSSKHYTTAYDLALLTSKAMESDVFREVCGEKTVSKSKYNFTRDYQNINKILWKIPNANGVKTGYTGQAGKCLVSSVKHEDRDIIIVVLNCSDRWNQTEKIFRHIEGKYVFQNKATNEIMESEQMANLGSLIEDNEVDYGFREECSLEVEVFKPLNDIQKGNILGKIFIKNESDESFKEPLVSKRNIKKDSFNKLIFPNEESKD